MALGSKHYHLTFRRTACPARPGVRCRRSGPCQVVKRAPSLAEPSYYSESEDERTPTSSTTVSDPLAVARVLFPDDHMEAGNPGLKAYAPIGVALAAFRSALWILGIALDQPWFRDQKVVDAYLKLLGVTVTWRNPERIPAGRHLMVSNHCSVGDLMMLFTHPSLPQRYTHLITSSLPQRVTSCKNLPVLLRPASPAVYDELAASDDPSPVHLFPEGGMTNGQGMLRFSRGFTRIMQTPSSSKGQQSTGQQEQAQQAAQQQAGQQAQAQHQAATSGAGQHSAGPHHAAADVQAQQQLQQDHHSSLNPQHHSSTSPQSISLRSNVQNDHNTSPSATSASSSPSSSSPASSSSPSPSPFGTLPVVPVALRVRTLPGLNTHTLTSSFLANLFWLSFAPATQLSATVLPPMVPLPGEARGAFVNRVQAAIAAELGVEVYDLTIQQKRQLAQRGAAAARR